MYWWMVLDSYDNYDWDDFRHQVGQVAIFWAKDENEAKKMAKKWGIHEPDMAGRYKTVKDALKGWKSNQKGNKPHAHNEVDFAVKDGKMYKVKDIMNESKDRKMLSFHRMSPSDRDVVITILAGNTTDARLSADQAGDYAMIKNRELKNVEPLLKKEKIKYTVSEAYKVHYPSLKKLANLQFTDPRVNSEGRKLHVEKEGSFCKGEDVIEGHYVVYEDEGMPGSYIGIHISKELSEDDGTPAINVVAIDTNRSAVLNRVAYRARKSRIATESTMDEASNPYKQKKTTFGKIKKGETFYLPNDPDNAALLKTSNTKYAVVGSKVQYDLKPNQEVFTNPVGKGDYKDIDARR